MINAKASPVVKKIAAYGVRVVRCTRLRNGGRTASFDMPYSRRLAIIMLIRAVLATANMEMIGSKVPIGMPGAPRLTTTVRGVSLAASSPTGTTATAQIDT